MEKNLLSQQDASFELKISLKIAFVWLQLVFHFGSENQEEQLKNTLYVVTKQFQTFVEL